MKKKFVYRQLKLGDEIYYQLYKMVDPEVELSIKNRAPGTDVLEFYQEIEFEEDSIFKDFLYTQFHYENDTIVFINDPVLITKLNDLFYDKYHDFEVIPKNDVDIANLREMINKVVLYQETPVSEVLSIIKSNLDILDTDISDDQKRRLKHNILLYGPKGYGKRTFIELLEENLGVPCAIVELTSDANKNLNLVISAIGSSAMGNMKKAEHGIVFIKDNFDELSGEFEDDISPLMVVEALLETTYAELGGDQKHRFDLSKITYVLVKNTSTNCSEDLYDEGMSERLLNYFDDMVCFGRLSKEQIKHLILDNPESPLNLYQKVCQKAGKCLVIEPDFLDTLIDRAYYDIGGIELINGYIEMMIKTRWGNNPIILDRTLVEREVEDTNYLRDYVLEKEGAREPEKTSGTVEKFDGKDDALEDTSKFKIDLEQIRDAYRHKLEILMQYVKGQDEPLKNILYHALINDVIQNSNLSPESKKERINHMLIRGGAGSGKSYITGLVARVLGDKPFAEIDCKRYTEAGYVGKSIDDMLIKLYYAAGGNLKKAQRGILFLDEIDKLAASSGERVDVSRGSVQESLLKLMEGTIFDLEIKEGAGTKFVNFDTRELTVIAAGAFEGLGKIRDARIKKNGKKQSIGFQSTKNQEEVFIDKNYTLEDMQEFGMHAQLLRRIPFQCDLNQLKKDDYRNIMLNAKSSAFKIKIERIMMLGVKITYDEDFVEEFTEKVSKLGFGVSGISILTERIFANFETKLLEHDYDEVILNKECVTDPTKIILVEKEGKVLKKKLDN